MELNEEQREWTLSFKDGRVQMVQVDFRLNFLITDGRDHAWLHIATQGTLKSGVTETSFVPEQTMTLAPMLTLFNAVVREIRIAKTGQLIVAFERDGLMFVAPNAAYEAWQMECQTENGDCILVCSPGGEVAFFKDSNTQRIGNVHLN